MPSSTGGRSCSLRRHPGDFNGSHLAGSLQHRGQSGLQEAMGRIACRQKRSSRRQAASLPQAFQLPTEVGELLGTDLTATRFQTVGGLLQGRGVTLRHCHAHAGQELWYLAEIQQL